MEPDPQESTPSTHRGNDKIWAMLCHLSSLLGVGLVLPLVVYLAMKNESEFVTENAKEALNFHISVMIYLACSFLLTFILIGIPLLIIIGISVVILSILAAIKTSDGEIYRYPLTLRLVK